MLIPLKGKKAAAKGGNNNCKNPAETFAQSCMSKCYIIKSN